MPLTKQYGTGKFIKLLLTLIGSLTIISFSTSSQSINRDSIFELKLALFISEYQFLDSAYTSALHEIELSDSALVKQFLTIENLKEMDANNEAFIGELRAEINRMKADKTAWWIYPAGGGLILVIGILTGLLIQ